MVLSPPHLAPLRRADTAAAGEPFSAQLEGVSVGPLLTDARPCLLGKLWPRGSGRAGAGRGEGEEGDGDVLLP